VTELGLALSTLCLSARSPSAMAVAHGETRWRAPALTIGASVVPMIDAAWPCAIIVSTRRQNRTVTEISVTALPDR
jgi:hypothetical protein